MIVDGHRVALPPRQATALRRAARLEWITLGFLALSIALMGATMGGSQAMKTAWLDDIISVLPPAVFLFSDRVRRRAPSAQFPFGFHRAVSLAFLLSSFALLAMGAFLLIDGLSQLVSGHRPTISTVTVLGTRIWAGWPMIFAAGVTAAGAATLGHLKEPLARVLHNRALHADADMSRADWQVGLATIAGVVGVGCGLWWADAAAAVLVSLGILADGVKNLRTVACELTDRVPHRIDTGTLDPTLHAVHARLSALPWVRAATVRMHERGHTLVVEGFIVPRDERIEVRWIDDALAAVRQLDWRIASVTITPVGALPEIPDPPTRRPQRSSPSGADVRRGSPAVA